MSEDNSKMPYQLPFPKDAQEEIVSRTQSAKTNGFGCRKQRMYGSARSA